VFDILQEVSRQVNSLKRQASKARRYEELRAEAAARLRRLLAGRYLRLDRDASQIALELNLAASAAQKLSAEAAAQEQEYARLQSEGYGVEQELTEARRRLADLQLAAERAKGRLESQAQQIAAIEQRLAQGESETQALEQRAAALRAELDGQARKRAELEQETAAARERLAQKTEERERIQRELREAERRIEAHRQSVLRLLGESSTLKNQLAQVREYAASLERDESKARKEEAAALAELEWLKASIEETTRKLEERRRELEAVQSERAAVEAELEERRAGAAECRKKLDALRAEYSRIKARRDSLEEILSHRAYTTEVVKRLFTAHSQGRTEGLRLLGVLADFVEVDPAHERAVEEFLHEELEYILVEDWEQAERGIRLLRSDLEGRATFLVHPDPNVEFGAEEAEPAIGPETGIVARLSEAVRFTNGLRLAPPQLLPRLARCYLAQDRACAQRLALQHPGFYFLSPDGVCYSGYAVSGGKKAGSGPLALKRELRELAATVEARQAELNQTAAELERLEGEAAALGARLEELRSAAERQHRETLAFEHDVRKWNDEAARAGARLTAVRLDLTRLGHEAERARRQAETTEALIAEKEGARAEQEKALEAVREDAVRLQAAAAQAGDEHAALRAALAGMEERSRAEQAAEDRMRRECEQVERRLHDLAQEQETLGATRARLLADNVELDRQSSEFERQIAEAAGRVEELAAQESAVREKLAALDEALRSLRLALQEAQERRGQIEVELVRRQAELKYLDETSRKELGEPVSAVAEGQETAPDELELADLEGAYEDIKARMEALGPVNPQALEEYQEAQQRYDFLEAQRQDLHDSIRDTETAIREIDQETRRRFSEAFEAINGHFREMFRILFGGGSAEMRLTDETNLAESGIDIVASPPGKRLQNVLLLSGGEKALTALALLLAVFKYQPSPFCVLDEVDAPLDEPNIERLMRLIREMSSHTQFIIMTHAKRTMEAAEVLYGVTMQEPGVSKIVSVRLKPNGMPPPPAEPVAAVLPA
jgi:chromosome segregation protein